MSFPKPSVHFCRSFLGRSPGSFALRLLDLVCRALECVEVRGYSVKHLDDVVA